jgi:hypothetical protein
MLALMQGCMTLLLLASIVVIASDHRSAFAIVDLCRWSSPEP